MPSALHRFPIDLRPGYGIQVLPYGGAFLISLDPNVSGVGGGGAGSTFLTLTADPTSAQIPPGGFRLVWRSDLQSPQLWMNVGGTMINALAPRSY